MKYIVITQPQAQIIKKTVVTFPLGFGGLLTLLFITLKLTHNIEWSWVWVLSPLWIPYAAIAGLLVVILGFVLTIVISALLFALIAGIFGS